MDYYEEKHFKSLIRLNMVEYKFKKPSPEY